VYPAKPKVGIRTNAPNELWHIDVTIIRLLDGTKAEFYVRAHNETIRHAAFSGQTPDEMYFGNGDAVVINLPATRVRARQERMKANRAATCGVCAGGHDFGASQLQRAECGMS